MRRLLHSAALLLPITAVLLVACAGRADDVAAPGAVEPTVESVVVATALPAEATQSTASESVDAAALPEIDPATVSGDIVTAGSSTVYPLAEAIAKRFEDEGYTGQITIDSIGTGGGFERFCTAGETDIANASRPIKEDELAACAAIGRDPLELRVGTDALAVVVSAENTFVSGLTTPQLAVLFSTAEKWSDVDPSFPPEAIKRYIPGTDSGTFDFFVEHVFDKDKAPILAAGPEMSEDDNFLVKGVEASPYAVGFFGYAYFKANQAKLRAITVDGVDPTFETAEGGTYPLSRPLFLYSSATIIAERPQIGAFLSYFLQNVNAEIEAVGYFPASAEALAASRSDLATALQP